MSLEKENFLRTKLVPCLQRLDPATPPRWGKMSVQAMIEHFGGDSVRNASGRLRLDKIKTSTGHHERRSELMITDKPIK